MAIISFRINQEEYDLIKEYTLENNINLSSFIREALFDKVEEIKIIQAFNESKDSKVYNANEVFKELGI